MPHANDNPTGYGAQVVFGAVLALTLSTACATSRTARWLPTTRTTSALAKGVTFTGLPEPSPTPTLATAAAPGPGFAEVELLPYAVVSVPMPLPLGPVVISIDGTTAHNVWMLGVGPLSAENPSNTSHLIHSDGRTARLVQRDVCVKDRKSVILPCFTLVRASKSKISLDGTSPGANQAFLVSATRKSNGVLVCDPHETPSGWKVDRRWSAGEAFTISVGPVLTLSGFSDWVDMVPLEADELPHAVAVSRGGTHAWMIAKGNAVNSSDGDLQLLEWTGMRWRYRKDALPKGISPKDIVALTATSSGAYFGVTRTQLLVYDGARFLAQPVPKGFEPERLLGTDQAGLWVFGPNQVWRYREGVWHSIGVPILHAAAEWLSPTGDLWISGSNINVWQAIHDSDPIDLSAAAAQMVRLVPLPAPKAPR